MDPIEEKQEQAITAPSDEVIVEKESKDLIDDEENNEKTDEVGVGIYVKHNIYLQNSSILGPISINIPQDQLVEVSYNFLNDTKKLQYSQFHLLFHTDAT